MSDSGSDSEVEELKCDITKLIRKVTRLSTSFEELKNEHQKLRCECLKLTEENRIINLKLEYQPGGEGYGKAKEHFESLVKND